MLRVVDGDIFSSGCDVLVNPTNIDPGYMGALAGFFSRQFSGLEDDYLERCSSGKMKMGEVHVFKVDDNKVVANFPTVVKFGSSQSDISYVREGLKSLGKYMEENDWVNSVAIPALGCGVGDLTFDEVQTEVSSWYDSLKKKDYEVVLYKPR